MFNETSMRRMGGVDPRLAEILTITRQRSGVPFEVSEGLRSKDRQAEMVAQGKSQTYNSRHLTGNALDIYIVGPDGQPVWDFDAYRPIADTAKQVAGELGYDGFVWGGDWNTLKDGVHFQLGGAPHASTATSAATASPASSPVQQQGMQRNELAMLLAAMPRPQNNLLDPTAFFGRRDF